MKQIILRYGVFFILLVMAVGLVLILRSLSIRQKTSVQLFVTGARTARAYIAPPAPAFTLGDTVKIVQTTGGDITFRIEAVSNESSGQVLLLTPSDTTCSLTQAFHGSTHSPGYIYTGRTPLLRLVMEKVK